jgi:acetylornithine deacetylase
MPELVDLLSQLVAIDSVNPDLAPGAVGEGELARFVADWLRNAGLAVTLQEAAPGRPNVIGIVRGTGGGRSLMLNAHLDTVSTAGMPEGWGPRVEGNRLSGRGAYDMKGSLAAIMLAAADLAKNPPRGDVLVTAVVDEEYASIGTAAIVAEWTADAAILTEPTDLTLCPAHKGFAWLEIETFGVAAHGSLPDEGVDAIAKMGRVLVALDDLDRSLRANASHPLLRSGSLHASLIEGGSGLSTYPERCLLQVERRTIPGETNALVLDQIEAITRRLVETDRSFRADVRLGLTREPYEVALDQPIVQLIQQEAAAELGKSPVIEGGFGWMDSAILGAAGISTVIFGPSGQGAHAAVEWVDLESVEACRRIYAATAREFCG